uniref:CTP synthase N-terminal domain-containing protein n=1 Tax=Panagrolaimus superbus TaxID=310955 RepID=A0A914XW70_9BILA
MSLCGATKIKIILVTGGDINKGIVAASIAKLVQENGIHITIIKMDSCLNENTTNLKVEKYGEKYVNQDSSTVAVNSGNYERICDQIFTNKNDITYGKMVEYVKNNENGDKTYAPINVVQATIEWIQDIFEHTIDGKNFPKVCLIEYPKMDGADFLKALTQLKYDNPFIHIHCSKIVLGKCDSIQKSVENLQNIEWSPDIIICRSRNPLTEAYKEQNEGKDMLC